MSQSVSENLSWNFCYFRSVFRAFKQFLDFSGTVFHIKNKFEKKETYPILLGRAQPALTRARRLGSQARRSPSG
jgi:hypothetical protein